MISSRKIEDLHPKVAAMAELFISKCDEAGIDVIITSTYRDHEAQAALYAQGRTTAGKIVTKAKPGTSWHNWRLAFDFAPIVNGKATWKDVALFTRCGDIAEDVGLEWAGRWVKFRELAHLQYTNNLSISDLQNGKTID